MQLVRSIKIGSQETAGGVYQLIRNGYKFILFSSSDLPNGIREGKTEGAGCCEAEAYGNVVLFEELKYVGDIISAATETFLQVRPIG